ncbi:MULTISPECIES: alpha/beta hydrolase family protein [unclassified Bacillus (in: firmicutes)]|uniref:alpha/beta hydrolase family protein n=2 Tax=Bacillus TaxID=1386 RepID=UPI002FFE5924
MGNKIMISLGKLALAGSIGLSGIAGGLLSEHQVSAAENINEVNFEKKAKEYADLFKTTDWEKAYGHLSNSLQAKVAKEQLPTLIAGLTEAQFGKTKEITLKDIKKNGVHTNAAFTVTADQGVYELVLRLNDAGQIDDMLFNTYAVPGQYLNPSYNHPENYTEKQVVFGDGEFTIPGVLTVPKGEGPFPVVVLVHGSGAHDMDETFASLKPFRDMAVGLVNEGVAVLRYDKRTYSHAIKSYLTPKFTIKDETVLDANLAVEKLKAMPEIDAENIFVFGHSQGAFALPMIIDNDKNKDIKGVIGAAGPSGKFHELMIWQVEQQLQRAKDMNVPAEQVKAAEASVAFFKEQFSLLDDPQYSADNLPANFQFTPSYWWFDLRDFVPAELAKKQSVPTLLLQGGKDIQVPSSELDAWKKALKDRDNVDYKLYPDMFHMLVNFKGQIDGMTEYMTQGNVPQEFISDIAQWVKTGEIKEVISKPQEPSSPAKMVYWDSLLMKKGQIGKVTITKPINLWKREGDKLVFERILKPGEQYRVYRQDDKFGGQYGLGGGYYVTNMKGYVDYRTPSKAKLKELNEG